MTVGFVYGAECHLGDLSAAADNDYTLSENLRCGLVVFHGHDAFDFPDAGDEVSRISGEFRLQADNRTAGILSFGRDFLLGC